MMCEKCLLKQATVHMQQIINGEKSEIRLCQDCAAQHETPFSFDDFFQGFLNSFLTQQMKTDTKEATGSQTLQCPHCGLTYLKFKKIGRFGCAECYDTFRNELSPIFKSVQAGNIHQGKYPKKFGVHLYAKREIENLKKMLAKAVANEKYEEAAKLRDTIRELERSDSDGKMV